MKCFTITELATITAIVALHCASVKLAVDYGYPWMGIIPAFFPALVTAIVQIRFELKWPATVLIHYGVGIAWGAVFGASYSLYRSFLPQSPYDTVGLDVASQLSYGIFWTQVMAIGGLFTAPAVAFLALRIERSQHKLSI